MKIRQGFVSNSSSSSFIIVGNGSTKFTVEADLKDFGEVLTTEEEIKQHFFEQYCVKDLENLKKECELTYKECMECLQALKDGKQVLVGTVSSGCDDSDLSLYLYNNIEEVEIPNYEFIQRGN